MRRRLYFLLPNVNSARQIVNELLLARIDSKHIFVMAKEGVPLDDLPQASILEKSDLIYGLERGLLIGGFTGALTGIIASLSPEIGLVGGGLILACAFAGAIIGAWASGMIGTDVLNSRVKPYEPQLQQGEILLMVDVPKSDMERISAMVRNHHPEAHHGTVDPTIPAFP